MKLLNFTVIKLLLFLIIGILLGYSLNLSWKASISITVFCSLLLLILFIYYNRKFYKGIGFGIISYITMLSIGFLTQSFHQKNNHLKHYTNYIVKSEVSTINFKIHRELNSSSFYNRYEADIIHFNNNNASGRIILNIEKDSLTSSLLVGELYATNLTLKEPKSPLNPGQFNYKDYLRKNNIFHQAYVKPNELILLKKEVNTIAGYTASLRKHIKSSLHNYVFKEDVIAIINALLLGQKQDISEDLYDNYVNAGAIHILAISGLHIGIILLILNHVLKPIEYIKNGAVIKLVFILILLWVFAILTGLSASVVRAVTMFSFIAYGMHIKRATNTYNILAISMFFLLLFKPSFIFDVGFQLSYAAVFSILWIQPILYKKWLPKYKILDYFWQLLTVSIAAQIGVLPISLLYFHQFPGLFFVSNLVIIPFLGLILGLGILVILLAAIGLLPKFLATTYDYLISTMNTIISWIAKQENFIFEDIPFNWILVITSYFFIISLVSLISKLSIKRTYTFLVSILVLQSALIYNNFVSGSHEKLVLFHKSRASLLAIHKGHTLFVNDTNYKYNTTITNYKVSNQIKTVNIDATKNIYELKNKKILVVDSLGVYNIKGQFPDYVILTHSPRINLNRLIDSIKPNTIIADGSNYRSFIKRWRNTCRKRKIPFHATAEKGAFIIE